ncbi:FtsX-like permease family protein [Bacteroides sp. OttesenSCG-928-J23]|nr:FtsX-like permease family protein [Bacteroides sp. OttesenSCG-928-J23]
MKQLYYTLLTLLRGRNSNVIKVISLALGLFIGIILFARVAYELSYNTGYKEADRLSVILFQKPTESTPGNSITAYVPRVLMENFPDEVEAGTLVKELGEYVYYVGNERLTGQSIFADTLFFRTMGIPVTSGEAISLAMPGHIFVSEAFALRAFHTTDVIGKTLMRDRKHELTIRGTYQNVADNNSIRPDVILAYGEERSFLGWAFNGYIRLHSHADIHKVNERMDVVMRNHSPLKPDKEGNIAHFFLESMRKKHISHPEVKRIVYVLSFLAIALLLISAMNYVLISISGLAGRVKGIAVHKCNGASTRGIFSMFFWETALIILISVIVAILLITNLHDFVGELIEARVNSLFTLQSLWVPLLIILVLFILSALLPGVVYSRIPVTQLFHKYSDPNTVWKKLLLFVQFVGVAFIFGVSMVAFLQYKRVIDFDLGYSTENIAVGYVSAENMEVTANAIRNRPMVERIALSQQSLGNRYAMDWITDGKGEKLFLAGLNWIEPEFVNIHELVILEGRNVMAPGEVLVNEEFVKRMPWTDGAIGKSNGNDFAPGTIVGVLKDFVDNSLFEERHPLIFSYEQNQRTVTVKLREPFQESLTRLNAEVQGLFPATDIVFTSATQRQNDKYLSVRRFRDSAGIAFVAILVIALMGLFGYINDEVQRRSKEIGIRKVNGAQAANVLALLNKDIIMVAFPAVVIGVCLSYFVGSEWLDQFAGTQISLSVPFYLSLVIALVVLMVGCVIAKSWRVANDNPVRSIKSD